MLKGAALLCHESASSTRYRRKEWEVNIQKDTLQEPRKRLHHFSNLALSTAQPQQQALPPPAQPIPPAPTSPQHSSPSPSNSPTQLQRAQSPAMHCSLQTGSPHHSSPAWCCRRSRMSSSSYQPPRCRRLCCCAGCRRCLLLFARGRGCC